MHLPERGGHSISKVFEASLKPSFRSPAKAQACTVFPPFCFMLPSSINLRMPEGPALPRTQFLREQQIFTFHCLAFGSGPAPSSLFRKRVRPDGPAIHPVLHLWRNMSSPALIFDLTIAAHILLPFRTMSRKLLLKGKGRTADDPPSLALRRGRHGL